MRTSIVLLGLALLTSGLAFVPDAAAACEPLADPAYCTSTVRETAGDVADRAGDLLDRVGDLVDKLLTLECEDTPNGIRCE